MYLLLFDRLNLFFIITQICYLLEVLLHQKTSLMKTMIEEGLLSAVAETVMTDSDPILLV